MKSKFSTETWSEAISPIGGDLLQYTQSLQLICLSTWNNVNHKEYTALDLNCPQEIVDEFIFRMRDVSEIAYKMYWSEYGWVIDQLDQLMIAADAYGVTNPYQRLKNWLINKWRKLPIVSFNGRNFDLTVILPYFAWRLVKLEGEGSVEILKKRNSFLKVSTPWCSIIDLANYRTV